MKILIFHGYLLAGTGSNVYNAQLSRAFVRSGHDVHLLAQERAPERLPFVDAYGDWDGGSLSLTTRHEPVRCAVYRPDIGGILPVYVADRYDGIEAKPYLECTDEEVEDYIARNVTAVREIAERVRPDVALANHLVMGPVILARALGPLGVPYAVKVHGSALEYTVKRDPERFLPYAREGVDGGRAVLVGSRHTGESLWAAMDDPSLPGRTRLGPPGVDVESFSPLEPNEASARLRGLAQRLQDAEPEDTPEGSSFARDLGAAGRELAKLDPARERLVVFVGKLIVSKGVDLLAAAWPLVLARVPDATLVVVGFGGYTAAFDRLLAALAAGDLAAVRELAEEGRAAEGGPRAPLNHLLAFLDGLSAEEEAEYVRAAAQVGERVRVVGRLEHDELHDLLPACDAQVVPSTFPEAFGMVAAEGAACGLLPVSAAHSGLAEVSAQLAEAVGPEVAPGLSFAVGDDAVRDLAGCLIAWLTAPEDVREQTREALVRIARERFSWDGVARDAIAAAEGRLEDLRPPAA